MSFPFAIRYSVDFESYFEKLADQYPTPSEDSLIVGLGLGQLAATAVVCSNTVLDLIPLAVQAVRLAFRVGATVETVSRQSHDDNETEESWSMIVQGDVGEIESDLQHVQDEIVSKIRNSNHIRLTLAECTKIWQSIC